MKLHYSPEGSRLSSPSPFMHADSLHILCRKQPDGFFAEGESDGLVILTAHDGIRFSEYPVGIRAESGCIVSFCNRLHLFYEEDGEIRHAAAQSLRGPWQDTGARIIPDANLYQAGSWRDPWLWQDADGSWHMVLGAMAQGSSGRLGCIAHCVSDDLFSWTILPPLCIPGDLIVAPACPSMMFTEDAQYLLYTPQADDLRLHYRLRRHADAQFSIPYDDTLESRGFACGRAVKMGAGHELWGIVPTRHADTWRFNPGQYAGEDYNTWDEGGSLVCHALSAAQDLSLCLSPHHSLTAVLSRPNVISFDPLHERSERAVSSYCLESTSGIYAKLLSNNRVPDVCLLSLQIDCGSGLARAALAVQVDEDFAEGYYFYLEPMLRRVQLKSAFRMTDQGSWIFPHVVEMERFIPGEGGRFHLDLLVDHDIYTLYINRACAMTVRLRDYAHRRFGLAAFPGDAAFGSMQLFTPARTRNPEEAL